MTENEPRAPRKGPSRTIILAAVLGIVAGVAAVYVIETGERNAGDQAACAADGERLAAMRPLARGEVAAVIVPDRAAGLPDLAFNDTDGQRRTLADFRGKTVLLNLWATWCAPCREEMPEFDRLQAEMGGDDFEVVAISIDTQNPEKARDFYEELKIESLGFYADPKAQIFQDMKKIGKAVGLPTTLIIGPGGCEIGYLPGPAMWHSEDAKALVRAALGRS